MPRNKTRAEFLHPTFAAALQEFGASFLKTQMINHQGSKGTSRENALGDFFRQKLPNRYGHVGGEATDLSGQPSPQLDLMFYDRFDDFPFEAAGANILAAEALLASIEVKSSLNSAEIDKCILAARKLRSLKPYGNPLGTNNMNDRVDAGKTARYFHCVFAYDTDIKKDNWLTSESKRWLEATKGEYSVDLVYVLGRGLIHLDRKR